MTKAGVIYQMNWKTVLDNGSERVMQINIYDNSVQIDSVTGEETIYEMTASATPLKISTDKTEDKFAPIRAKTAVITFLNSDSINFSTFSMGEDDRFKVTITTDNLPIFTGWLQMTDIKEPFLTQFNQEVSITAIDGLGYLKGQELTDFDGNRPSGVFPIMNYIAWCLWKTGINLNILVFNNIREESNPGRWQSAATFFSPNVINTVTGFGKYFKVGHTVRITGSASNDGNKVIASVSGDHITVTGSITTESIGAFITWEDLSDGGCMYSTCYLDSKTFEDQPGTLLDCYTVLERILKRECFVEQRQNNWYIFRIKEFRNDFQQYQTQYDQTGSFNGFTAGFNIQTAIGLKPIDGTPFPVTPDAVAFFSKAQTSRVNSRPTKEWKLTYKYESPSEVPCNVNYERGDEIAGSFPDEIDEDGNTAQVKHYNIDCWTLKRGAGSSATTVVSEAYIKRLFVNNYEKQRMILLTLPTVAGNPKTYIESENIPVGAKDKFDFSFNWATEVDVSGSPTLLEPVASLWLSGDDGSFWKLSEGPPVTWLTTNSADEYGLNTNLIIGIDFSTPTNEWFSKSVSVPPIPVSGNLKIRLHASGAFTSTVDNFNVKFSDITFDYLPFINGGYGKYTGQTNTSTRPDVYKSKSEDEVSISNSPKRIFKGALMILQPSGLYSLAGRFYDGQEFLYSNDGNNHLMSYGELQVRSVHNQYRNSNEIFQLTAQGLNGYQHPDPVQRIYNRDLEPMTSNKTFQLLWIDQDWRNSEWQATMEKNFDENIGFVMDDYEFKYIT